MVHIIRCSDYNNLSTTTRHFEIGELEHNILRVFCYPKEGIFIFFTDDKEKFNQYVYRIKLSRTTHQEFTEFKFLYKFHNYKRIYQVFDGTAVAYTGFENIEQKKGNYCLFVEFPFREQKSSLKKYQNNFGCIQFDNVETKNHDFNFVALDINIIFAKDRKYNVIKVFFVDFYFQKKVHKFYNYGEKVLGIENLNYFDYAIIKTKRIKLIIVNYNTNEILEYVLYSYEQPVFTRKYATYGKKFDPLKGLKT